FPHLEQEALAKSYDWKVNGENQAISSTRIKLFECPSAPANRVYQNHAIMDYYPMTMVVDDLVAKGLVDDLPHDKREGVLADKYNVVVKMTDVTDGLSNSFLLVEDAGLPELYLVGFDAGQVASAADQQYWAHWNNRMWLHGASLDGKTAIGPCAVNCTNNEEAYSF